MQRQFRDTFALGGWLFADLMLAIAVIFFAANTEGRPPDRYIPTIKELDPASSSVGTKVTVRGSNLLGASDVRFGDVAAKFEVISANELLVDVPKGATTDPITIVTTARRSVVSAGHFVVKQPCREVLDLEKHELKIAQPSLEALPPDRRKRLLRNLFEKFRGSRAGVVLTFGHAESNDGSGDGLARLVNDELREVFPDMFPEKTIMEPFLRFSRPYGSVSFHAYFFAQTCE